MTDHRVISQYHSFVIMLGGAGITRRTYALVGKGAVLLMQLCCSWMCGAQDKGSRNCN